MEAVVVYNYVAREPDELTIKRGDIIKEIKIMFGGWWEGTLRDKRGMFPDNFVKLVNAPPGTTETGGNGNGNGNGNTSAEGNASGKSEDVTLRNGSGRKWCEVVFSYEPCNDDELKLMPQDQVEFLGEAEEGWWRGRLRGQIGVFPSNFVSSPVCEEPDKRHKEKEKRCAKAPIVYEECRVLFPYKAANEDELTLVEGDIIKLLSRDAPDKGWWKGELRGQIGLFPDNFVEVIGIKSENQDQDNCQDQLVQTTTTNSLSKYHQQIKKGEKAHVRKSLDVKNVHLDTAKKTTTSSSSSSSISSTSPLANTAGVPSDKKPSASHSILASLKCIAGDGDSDNGNGSSNATLGEELDGVERGEGVPLSHLTASRAKAPRRRPPTSQHLRHHATGTAIISATAPTKHIGSTLTQLDGGIANGNSETGSDQLRDVNHEVENALLKARRKPPWVEELKLNQLERRKIASIDRLDKVDIKKEKTYSRIIPPTNVSTKQEPDTPPKPESDVEADIKQKEKEPSQRTDTVDDVSPDASENPAFVPYSLYSQLLKRVAVLEEQHATLQRTVGQLSEQLVPLLGNVSVNSKV